MTPDDDYSDLRRGVREPGAIELGRPPPSEPSALAGLALLADLGRSFGGKPGSPPMASARRLASARAPRRLARRRRPRCPRPGWPTPFALLLWSNLVGFEAERSLAVRLAAQARRPDDREPVQGRHGRPRHDRSSAGPGSPAPIRGLSPPRSPCSRWPARAWPTTLGPPRGSACSSIARSPTGGWNLGNPVVFGTTLRPLPGPTGLALLALARLGRIRSKVVESAVAYLRSALSRDAGAGLAGLGPSRPPGLGRPSRPGLDGLAGLGLPGHRARESRAGRAGDAPAGQPGTIAGDCWGSRPRDANRPLSLWERGRR